MSTKIVIIGAGIVGLAVAKRALERGLFDIHVIDKESRSFPKPSNINSGVIHSGVYYQPGSLRAKLSRRGNSSIKHLMRDLGVDFIQSGKLIVAGEGEEERLKQLALRAKANGVEHEIMSPKTLESLQPGLGRKKAGIYVHSTAYADPKELLSLLRQRLIEEGVEFHSQEVVSISHADLNSVTNVGVDSSSIIINAAGFGSLSIAQESGVAPDYLLLPITGRYLSHKGAELKINLPIYGMPNSKNVSLGHHLTPSMNGGFKIGPTAEISLGRFLFDKKSINALLHVVLGEERDVLKAMRSPSPVAAKKQLILGGAKLIPAVGALRASSFFWEPHSHRPQIIDTRTKSLVEDFVILEGAGGFHLLNIISPGWTSAVELADEVLERAL